MKHLTKTILAVQAAALLMTGCQGAATAEGTEDKTPQAVQEEASVAGETTEEMGDTASEAPEAESVTEAAAGAGTQYDDPKTLPAYVYQGSEEYMDVICDYLVSDELSRVTDSAEVYIPFGMIVETDDKNPDDIIAYGSFNIDGYDLLNTTLFVTTGSRNYGAIHLKKGDDGKALVTSTDLSEVEEESKEVFAAVDGLYDKVMKEADSKLSSLQEEAIAGYVKANGLNITQWQGHGQAPKPVQGAAETPEEAQFYRYVSPLGYEMTYDLREFTLSSDDSGDLYGKVEDNDVWTGTLMAAGKSEGADTDAAIAKALSFTEASGLKGSDAAIGSGIACKRAEYDEKHEDGRIFRYVCYAVPAGNDVITVLIETTVEKGVSELSVEELEKVFESTLSTFKLS